MIEKVFPTIDDLTQKMREKNDNVLDLLAAQIDENKEKFRDQCKRVSDEEDKDTRP